MGADVPEKFDLSSLRILGSVGEPINPEAYVWYRHYIGGDQTPVVDTWWQTETGMHMISPMPGVTKGKPGAAMRAVPGVSVEVVNDEAQPVYNGSGGYLVITKPWPAMLRTIWGDDQRYTDTYWSRFPDLYFAGDGAKKDEDGDLWLLGRVDDVMNVSGHRMSTTEIESALVSHPKVAEAAVVGATDDTTGQAIVAFVILRSEAGDGGDDVVAELRKHVANEISPIARPRQVMVVEELPKTRSGKIMRRLLRDIAENRELGRRHDTDRLDRDGPDQGEPGHVHVRVTIGLEGARVIGSRRGERRELIMTDKPVGRSHQVHHRRREVAGA